MSRLTADAIGAWLDGRWHDAGRVLDELLVRWPTDMLALVMGHLLDFFIGDASNLRDRVGRSLPSFDPEHPAHRLRPRACTRSGWRSRGNYAAAEAAGLEALERQPATTSGRCMRSSTPTRCRPGRRRASAFLRSREADWGSGNLFTVHNWWHLALYLLEAGRYDDALAIYDAEVHNDESTGVPLEMLDASALLWRLTLDGVDTGGRYRQLADAWEGQLFDDPWYVFNDLHAVIALVRRRTARRCARGRASASSATSAPVRPIRDRHAAMTAEVGLAGLARDRRLHRGSSRRRHRRAAPDPHGLQPLRWLARATRPAPAHADRVGDRGRAPRPGRALLDERLSFRETSVYGLLRRSRFRR